MRLRWQTWNSRCCCQCRRREIADVARKTRSASCRNSASSLVSIILRSVVTVYCDNTMRCATYCHTFWVASPCETDAKILAASPWRTGGDHQDALVLSGWRLSSRTWISITFPWMKQLTWLRVSRSRQWRVDQFGMVITLISYVITISLV